METREAQPIRPKSLYKTEEDRETRIDQKIRDGDGSRENQKVENQKQKVSAKWTFITPFAIFVSLMLPSLVVLTYIKSTVGFFVLQMTDFFVFVQAAIVFTFGLAILCGLAYLVRARGKLGRVSVVLITAVLAADYAYIFMNS